MLNTKWRWRTKSKPLLADLPSTRCCGRLRLLCQIGDKLIPGVEEFLLVDDVVPVDRRCIQRFNFAAQDA